MVRLMKNVGRLSDLRWSADGRYLAFKSGDSEPHLIVAETASAKTRSITALDFNHGITAFDWSPDGRKIYFAVDNTLSLPKEPPVSFPPRPEPDDDSTIYRLAVDDFGRRKAERVIRFNGTANEFVVSP